MAVATPCQTPGALFHVAISDTSVSIVVDLPAPLDLDEAAATQLDADLHNSVELALARWWRPIRDIETGETMSPTIGRIVHYQLTAQDAAAINVRRADFKAFEAGHAHPHEPGQPAATGHIAHIGNPTHEGDVYPATVVRVFDPASPATNLQVHLDGNDAYWATSRCEGEGPGFWSWPPRVGA